MCSDLKSIKMTSLESITAYEVLFALELGCFVLKRRLEGLREEGVYKLTLASTPKRCRTIGCTETSPRVES